MTREEKRLLKEQKRQQKLIQRQAQKEERSELKAWNRMIEMAKTKNALIEEQ